MVRKNRYELSLMKHSGYISAKALKEVLQNIRVGITGLELNSLAEKKISSLGGKPSFQTVPGYQWASCITINEQVVHGIPTDRKIKKGDFVSVDLGTVYRGWHTDCAWTVLIGKDDPAKEKFLRIGEEALWDGINQAKAAKRIGDISYAIQSKVESGGYHVVRALVGHGVGRSLHEEPEVPGYGSKGTGMILKAGMTLAIEVIYAQETSEVVLGDDGWTFSTADGSWAGLFEMTVVVGRDQAEVLTDFRHI